MATATETGGAPEPHPGAELVATGAELLNGRSVNTHARSIARGLAEAGLELAREATVPDDAAAIADAVREALARRPLVFVTGGLGPTCDDLTREALSALLGRGLVEDAETVAALAGRYERAGRAFTASRRRQAVVLEGAAVLPNPAGAAPGQRIDLAGRTLFVLPGPPHELEAILAAHVVPWLRAHAGRSPARRHLFMVSGPGESDIVDRFEAAAFAPAGVALAYCASPGRVEVRLEGAGAGAEEFARAVGRARELLGADAYAERRIEVEERLGELLRGRGETVAVAESCTGGLIGHRLTEVPGSSAWFRGGVVAYHDDVKAAALGVPPGLLAREGAVSAPVAEAMARGARERLGADWGIAATGIAGPGGERPGKPVGLVHVAVAGAGGAVAAERRFGFGRTMNKWWTSQAALDLLRRRLAGVG